MTSRKECKYAKMLNNWHIMYENIDICAMNHEIA